MIEHDIKQMQRRRRELAVMRRVVALMVVVCVLFMLTTSSSEETPWLRWFSTSYFCIAALALCYRHMRLGEKIRDCEIIEDEYQKALRKEEQR